MTRFRAYPDRRLDGELQQVESLFRLVDAGLALVGVASDPPTPLISVEALDFAEHAYRASRRLVSKTSLTEAERLRLDQALMRFRQALEDRGCIFED